MEEEEERGCVHVQAKGKRGQRKKEGRNDDR